MKVKAYAKVNLALDVLARKENGYHELDMIMAPVSIFDELDIEADRSLKQDEIICEGMVLEKSNTLTKTLDLLRQKVGNLPYYRVILTKKIPSRAGMGGGSADAAALLKTIIKMEKLDFSEEEMVGLAAQIGADVPFCLYSTLARVRGIGEQISLIDSDWKLPVLLIKPEEGVSTAECFAAYDENPSRAIDVDIVEDALVKHDPALLYQTMENALEPVAMDRLEVLHTIKEQMNDEGIVRVMMTGSGSCMMGFCIDEEILDATAEKLKESYPFVCKAWIGGNRSV